MTPTRTHTSTGEAGGTPAARHLTGAPGHGAALSHVSPGLVQRCGGARCPEGTCDHKGSRLLRSVTGLAPAMAPPVVHEVLRSPGQPLDSATRAFIEPRLGHDFSQVRVHTGAQAAASAEAVGASAYTVGSQIVFGAGGYTPATAAGRRLLAHELTHVAQQERGGGATVSASLEVGAPDTPHEREAEAVAGAIDSGQAAPSLALAGSAGSVQRACPPTPTGIGRARPSPYPCIDTGPDAIGGDKLLFCQDSDELIAGQDKWLDDIADRARRAILIEIHGNASTEASKPYNLNLACLRAKAIETRLRAAGASAPTLLFAHEETTAYGPAPSNRNVIVRLILPPQPEPEEEEEEEPEERPEGPVCGPDVTDELKRAMASLRSSFAALTPSQKDDSCDALDSVAAGGLSSWDVTELHNNAWIYRQYRPACASRGATPRCGSTVQVGNDCWYAGSPNYVTFGVACKLCAGHHAGTSDASRFTEAEMLDLIAMYKGPHSIFGLAPNFAESQQWAKAGYRGWPAGGHPTGGDRNNCSPTCPTPHTSPAFNPRWCPHIDPLSMCSPPR